MSFELASKVKLIIDTNNILGLSFKSQLVPTNPVRLLQGEIKRTREKMFLLKLPARNLLFGYENVASLDENYRVSWVGNMPGFCTFVNL